MENINKLVVRVNGQIDKAATLAQFEELLAAYEVSHGTQLERIAGAVHAVFDAHLGERLPAGFLFSACLSALKVEPKDLASMTKQIHQYLTTNSKSFNVKRGRGNGWARTGDAKPVVEAVATEAVAAE